VPMSTPGITISQPLDKMGMRSSDTVQVFFDNVRVPQANRIGDEGHGFRYQMLQFQEERLFAAASLLHTFDWLLADTAAYTRERKLFGTTVLGHQVVQFRLAELATEVLFVFVFLFFEV
jgi:citronellyl-CoA dehydrogenase